MGAAGIWLIPTFGDLGPCTSFPPRDEISPESGNVECEIPGHLARIAMGSRPMTVPHGRTSVIGSFSWGGLKPGTFPVSA
jgi:hypothetical protein